MNKIQTPTSIPLLNGEQAKLVKPHFRDRETLLLMCLDNVKGLLKVIPITKPIVGLLGLSILHH